MPRALPISREAVDGGFAYRLSGRRLTKRSEIAGREEHIELTSTSVEFNFTGKSGQPHRRRVRDPRVLKAVERPWQLERLRRKRLRARRYLSVDEQRRP